MSRPPWIALSRADLQLLLPAQKYAAELSMKDIDKQMEQNAHAEKSRELDTRGARRTGFNKGKPKGGNDLGKEFRKLAKVLHPKGLTDPEYQTLQKKVKAKLVKEVESSKQTYGTGEIQNLSKRIFGKSLPPQVINQSQFRKMDSDITTSRQHFIQGFGDDADVRASYELLCHNVEQIVVEAKEAQEKIDKKVWSMEKRYVEQIKKAKKEMVDAAKKSRKEARNEEPKKQ